MENFNNANISKNEAVSRFSKKIEVLTFSEYKMKKQVRMEQF